MQAVNHLAAAAQKAGRETGEVRGRPGWKAATWRPAGAGRAAQYLSLQQAVSCNKQPADSGTAACQQLLASKAHRSHSRTRTSWRGERNTSRHSTMLGCSSMPSRSDSLQQQSWHERGCIKLWQQQQSGPACPAGLTPCAHRPLEQRPPSVIKPGLVYNSPLPLMLLRQAFAARGDTHRCRMAKCSGSSATAGLSRNTTCGAGGPEPAV